VSLKKAKAAAGGAQARKASPGRKTSSARKKGTVAAPTESDVAARAYELFLARGGEHGHDREDWQAALRELTQAQP
jgi:hypothetical protein